MDKILKLYKYVDGVNDTPFPNKEEQAILYSFGFNAKSMGGARTATATLKHRLCLDDLWSEEVYTEFNGERLFIRSIPSSSKNNTDGRYEHELELYSEIEILNHVYFIDAVQGDSGVDVYKSNSTKIIFTGDINQFAERLNASLSYSGLDFNVVVDEGVTSEDKMVSFEDKYIMSALQEIFNIYELPYYFVGRTIHIGYTQNTITYPLKYGHDEALLSIAKNNANYQIINRITGIGSTDNIPYYYPNESDNREEVEASGKKWITPMPNLMPSIYRESEGAEMFYNAKNNTYPTPEGGYYEFENLYEPNKAKEGKVTFEDIKPSIVGMTNASSQRIDMFIDFAYDQNDNDEVDEEGNYIHPYFFAKMRKTDGEFGFNLFDQAIESQTMQISFTSGVCGACSFEIGVGEETQKNIVQVDDSGNLKRDENGNVLWENQVPQDRQNDTSKYEVWIALKKEDSTYGQIMPNATQNLKPSTSDTFVILGINMPLAYIKAAEKKLDESLIKYMWMNNRDKFTFSIKFSRIFFTEHPEMLEQLNENSRVIIEYNNQQHTLYVDSYSYNMDADSPLPEIEIDLVDTLTIGQNSLQTALDSIKQDILSSIGGGDVLKQGLKYFLRKDIDDVAKGKIAFRKGLDIGSFSSLVSGGTFRLDSDGKSYLEVDKLLVRMKAIFEELQIKKVSHIGGEQYITPAAIEVKRVVEGDTYYRCYATEDDNISYDRTFAVGDQALSKMADLTSGEDVSNRYYWRLVVNVGKNYIDLSKTDADSGSDIPQVGDTIVSLGNRSDKDRQNAIIISSVSLDSPSIKMLQGIDSYTLTDKDVISQGFDTATNRAFLKIFGDLFAGAPDNSTYIKYDSGKKSLEIKGKFITRGGTDIDTALSDLQNQIDGNIETWFYGPEPTLNNEPAVNWELNSEKDSHLGDLYYSGEGKAYRFQKEGDAYVWKLIQDTDITKALGEAKKAQDAAANAQTSADNAQTAVGDLNEYVDGSFKDGIITNAEAVAIEKYLNTVDESKKSIEGPYLILYANKYLEGTPKSNLKNAYDAVIASINTLVSKINTAIADNATTVQEKNEVDIAFASFNTKQQDYEKAVENANNAIQDKLKSFTDKVASDVAGYEYLKEAFANDTTIEGGVVSTSIVYTGYKNTQGKFVPMSGINGVYLEDAAKGHGISYWTGGNLIDRETYVDPTDIPSDAAKAVIRMDGSGYFANGNLTWTKEGILHADPLSFFVGEEMVGDILKLFSPIYDESDGTTVIGIQARYPLLVRGGVTQYAGTPLTVTDIFQGLVLDPNTLEWNSKGQLTVKGGAGSDFDKNAMWAALAANTTEPIHKSHLTTALQGYATEEWVTGKNYAVKSTTLAGYGITDGVNKVSVTGTGNAVTSASISGHTLTLTKGATFSTSDHNHDSRYVNVSGDTMTGDLFIQKAGRTDKLYLFHSTEENKCGISLIDKEGEFNTLKLTISDLTWKDNKVWHAGNDGSGSGLDADLLDGTHKSGLFTALTSTSATNISVTVGGTTKSITDLYANSAAKLETARTIWGQSFDGTKNISGALTSVTDITGTGTFTGANIKATDSVYVNGIRLYKSADNTLKIEGNLLVTGGITQYAVDPANVSDLMDNILTDDTTIRVNPDTKELEVIGGIGIDLSAMWDALSASTSEQINRSHLTTALQGYATESWVSSNFLGKTDKAVDSDKVDGEHNGNLTSRYLNPTSPVDDLNNYRYNGFTAWSTVSVNRPYEYGTLFQFSNMGTPIAGTNNHWVNQIAFGTNNRIYARQRINTGVWSSWSNIAYLSDTIPQAENSNKLQNLTWSDFFSRRYYYLDYGAQSTSNFYPIFFFPNDIELDCEIHSDNVSSADAYNQNRIHFQLTAQGWSDTGVSFRILSRNNYSDSEITIGAIGYGAKDGGIAIWVRGGKRYRLYCNKTPNMKTSDFTYGSNGEKYTVGTNLDGGANSSVNIIWKNDSNRNNGLVATVDGNVYSATKLQNTRTIWGRPFNGEQNVNGDLREVNNIYTNRGTIDAFTFAYNPSDSHDGLPWYGMTCYGNNEIGISGYGGINFFTSAGSILILSPNGRTYANSVVTNDWFRSEGNTGWYSENWGGGWYMNDSTWIRAYNNKNIYTGGTIQGGKLIMSSSGIDVTYGTNNEFIRIGSSSDKGDFVTFKIPGNNNKSSYFEMRSHGIFYVSGNILSSGGITQYSDSRAKTIIEQISLSIKDIAQSPAIRFKWNGWKQQDDGKTHIGGIAQYVQRILPEAIYDTDGALTMDYAITGYIFAVNTAKHLLSYETKTDKEIKKLKKRIVYLENKLKSYEGKVI